MVYQAIIKFTKLRINYGGSIDVSKKSLTEYNLIRRKYYVRFNVWGASQNCLKS